MTSWWLPSFVFFLHNLISFQYKSVGSSNPYTYSPSYAPQADVGPLNKENKRKTDQTLSVMLFYPSTVSMKQLKHFILKNAMSSLAIPVSFRQILVNYYPWHFYTLTITPLFTEVRFRNQGNLSGQKNVAKLRDVEESNQAYDFLPCNRWNGTRRGIRVHERNLSNDFIRKFAQICFPNFSKPFRKRTSRLILSARIIIKILTTFVKPWYCWHA